MSSSPRDTSLTIKATTDQLARIRDYVFGQCVHAGISAPACHNLVLAVDEACSNIIQHAYHNNPAQTFNISIRATKNSVTIEITDSSPPFDPASVPLPDMSTYFEERRHHGLGILLMTKILDSIEYVPASSEGATNKLILTFKVS